MQEYLSMVLELVEPDYMCSVCNSTDDVFGQGTETYGASNFSLEMGLTAAPRSEGCYKNQMILSVADTALITRIV